VDGRRRAALFTAAYERTGALHHLLAAIASLPYAERLAMLDHRPGTAPGRHAPHAEPIGPEV
jgi:hypothetical protein